MGFWQNFTNSYDKNADALRLSYPLSATSISNNSNIIAVITIDGNGEFIKAEKIEQAKQDKTGKDVVPSVQICIPVTEKSMGRSSGIAPHPVFDQYEYLKGSGKKYKDYIEQMKDFSQSEFATEQVRAIYQYVKGKKVGVHLKQIKPKAKTMIVFQVEIKGKRGTRVWEEKAFFDAWHQYYLTKKRKLAKEKESGEMELSGKQKLSLAEKKKLREMTKLGDAISLDYIAGTSQPIATSHPKKISISKASANAKLISDNDKTNFTFRGKFRDSSEAFSIGYESSQKAHQFLRYLINDGRGYYCGEQVILSFTIGSTEKLLPPPIKDKSIWAFLQESQAKTESDEQIALRAATGIDYADALRKSLAGFGQNDKTLEQHAKTAVIALDAATTGRLSITFYRELDRNEYLENIADWHSSCKWNQKFWSTANKQSIPFFGAPAVDTIIEAVYGKPRGAKDESYTKIKKAGRERLLRCIFDGAFLPTDYMVAAVHRASNPLGITKDGKFDRNGFDHILSTACALVRKYYQQTRKEEYKLSIELNRKDRDYLYGRLLGAADKLEEYALYKRDKGRVVTAAIRHMQAFAQRPFRTWQTIHSCLNPYIQTVKGSFAFQEIEAIKNKFASVSDYENDKPLNGSYLIGYYHERAYIDSLAKAANIQKSTIDKNEKEDVHDRQ